MKTMKLTHKQKTILAKKMMTATEISNHCPVFQSVQWSIRKKANWDKECNKLKYN